MLPASREAANSYFNAGSPNSHSQSEMSLLPAGHRKHQANTNSVDYTSALNTQPHNYTRTCKRTNKLVKTKSANRIPQREILPKATREASRVQTAGLILLIE